MVYEDKIAGITYEIDGNLLRVKGGKHEGAFPIKDLLETDIKYEKMSKLEFALNSYWKLIVFLVLLGIDLLLIVGVVSMFVQGNIGAALAGLMLLLLPGLFTLLMINSFAKDWVKVKDGITTFTLRFPKSKLKIEAPGEDKELYEFREEILRVKA